MVRSVRVRHGKLTEGLLFIYPTTPPHPSTPNMALPSAAKRPCTEPGEQFISPVTSPRDPNTPITLGFLEEWSAASSAELATHTSQIAEMAATIQNTATQVGKVASQVNDLATTVGNLPAVFQSQTITLIQKYDREATKKHEYLESLVREVNTNGQNLAKDQEKTKTRIAELERVLAIAEQATVPPDYFEVEDFTRSPLLHVLRIGTQAPVAKPTLQNTVKEWLEESNYKDDQWELKGPNLGKQFYLHFKGAGDIGARRAKNANQSLQQEDGSWKPVFTRTPDGVDTKCFIGPDKNDQTIAQERMCKKIEAVLKETHQGHTFKFMRNSCTVKCDWKTLVEARATSRTNEQYWWKQDIIQEFSIDKERVLAALASAASASSTPWSL